MRGVGINIIGIYQIVNLSNNKVYVGQSINIKKRWATHKRKLRNKKHDNAHLQNAYNKYGEEIFEFEVLEECDVESLDMTEYKWIMDCESHNENKGYNITIPNNNRKISSYESAKNKTTKGYEKEELISFLQEYYYHYGKVPTQRSITENKNYPNHVTYHGHFGSFKEALIEADLFEYVSNGYIFERKEYTKNEVLEAFSKFVNTYGRFPNSIESKQCKKFNLPTTNIVVKHFGSIHELREVLGFSKERLKELEKEESLKMLYNLYIQEGKVSARGLDKSNLTKSAKFYRNNFNGLAEACRLAEVPYAEHMIK